MNRPVYPGEHRRRVYNGSGLSMVDRALLSYLAYYAEKHRDADGWFAVAQDAIAVCCGCDRRTVQRRLPALVVTGWLSSSQLVSGGRYLTTRYALTVPASPADSGTESHGDSGTESHGTMRHSPAGDGGTESQRLRSKSLSASETEPQATAQAETRLGQPENPPHPDTTALLDQLGIIRKTKPKSAVRRGWK